MLQPGMSDNQAKFGRREVVGTPGGCLRKSFIDKADDDVKISVVLREAPQKL